MTYDNNPPTVKDLAEKARDYIDTSVQLAKLKAINKVSGAASSLATMIVLPLLILVVIILFSVGFSFWLGKMLGAYHYGFFIIGTFVSLVILLIYKFRNKWLKMPVANSLIENILK
jgi:hypothetical protein